MRIPRFKFPRFKKLIFPNLAKQTGGIPRTPETPEVEKLIEIVRTDPKKRKLFAGWGYAAEFTEKRLIEKGVSLETIKFFVEEGILIKLPATFGGARYFLSQDRGTSLLSEFKKE